MNPALSTILYIFSFLFLSFFQLEAAKKPTFANQEQADSYLTLHYNLGAQFYNNQEWKKAANEFEKVIYFFPSSEAAAEASYFLAVCYFEMKEYDFANEEFSSYIKASEHPAFFEDAVYFKFCAAEHLKIGKKRRPFKYRYFPKLICGQDMALTIYDEVVAALPNHELTVQALMSKGDLLRKMREYRLAVETYQLVIKRFPRDNAIPACYVNIANTYIDQSKVEFQNPDILALAELNAQKFAEDFPRDENVDIVNQSVFRIKEYYAKGLADIGRFYERIDEPEAAVIYYQSAVEEFPDTYVAEFCRSRLLVLRFEYEEEMRKEQEEEIAEEMMESEICQIGANISEEQAVLDECPSEANEVTEDRMADDNVFLFNDENKEMLSACYCTLSEISPCETKLTECQEDVEVNETLKETEYLNSLVEVENQMNRNKQNSLEEPGTYLHYSLLKKPRAHNDCVQE